MIITEQYEAVNGQSIPKQYIERQMFQRLGDYLNKFYHPEEGQVKLYDGLTATRYRLSLMVCNEKEYLEFRRKIREAINLSNLLSIGEKNIAEIIVGKVFKEFESKQEHKDITTQP